MMSLSIFEQRDLDQDIRANGWGIKEISEIRDSEEIFISRKIVQYKKLLLKQSM